MKIILSLFTKYKFELLVFSFATLAVCNLFQKGLPPNHDGQNQVVRSYEFDKTLRDWSWYPVWAPDLNYTFGVPLFNYVYPLPNYASSLFHVFGASFIDTFKLNLIFASYLGAFFSFFYARSRFKNWGGLLASVFYTFSPYHFLDIYVRGSVGETWALAFFPLSLWMLDRVIKKKDSLSIILSGMSFALVIFSHNILAVMFAFFLATYACLLIFIERDIKSIVPVIMQFVLGLLISSVFFIPAILEEQYVVGLKILNVLENFPEVYQLIIPSWGSGYSGDFSATQMSFQIGLANLLVFLLLFLKIFRRKKIKSDIKVFISFFLLWFLILCFLITSYSYPIWQKVTIMQYFQFPWRFLSIVILCCSVFAGGITVFYKSKILYMVLIVIAILSTISYAKAPYFYNRTDEYYIHAQNFIYGTNSIADAFQTAWFTQQKKVPPNKAVITKGKGSITYLYGGTTKQFYVARMDTSGRIVFNTAYFPGWTVYIDGKKGDVKNDLGKISTHVSPGTHDISLRLEDTGVRRLGKSIFVVTLIAILSILIRAAVIQLFYGHRHR